MTNFEEMKALALQAGFGEAWAFDPRKLVFLPQVREMCSADRCKSFGRNWCCPPACGSLEDSERQAAGFEHGALVQTVGVLEDEFDFEGMEAAAEKHRKCFEKFAELAAAATEKCMCMGMGACTRCAVCTYPDAPCRFPELAHPSMEAMGLQVSDVCKLAGAPYYYGKGTVSYTSCILF